MEITDEAVIALRKKGWTLQEIGSKFRVSRQRIHQILSRNDTLIPLQCISQPQFQDKVLTEHTLNLLRDLGIANPQRRGKRQIVYTPEEIERLGIIARALRTCPMCGGPKRNLLGRACSKCWQEPKMAWGLRSKESRQRHRELCRIFRLNQTEEQKEKQRACVRRYEAKLRRES